SSISLMEVAVSWLDERTGVTRWGAALGVGFVVFVIGGGYIISREYILFVDFIAASLLMPLGGFLTAVFAGWVIEKKLMESELGTPFFTPPSSAAPTMPTSRAATSSTSCSAERWGRSSPSSPSAPTSPTKTSRNSRPSSKGS